MVICFIANANSANTQSWANHFSGLLGHETHIITLHRCEQALDGIYVHNVFNKYISGKISYAFSIPRIRRIVRSINPDILVGYRLTSYGFLAACTGIRPLVLAADGGDVQVQARNSMIKKWFVKYALSKGDLVHAWSENIRDALLELNVHEEKILVLPRGIELDLFRIPHESPKKGARIITTRSLEDYCRIEVILEAIALAKKEFPYIEYLVIGDGPHRAFLEELTKNLGLWKNVSFLGKMDRQKIADLLGESEIYCSMLETDGLSASLHEAMAAGAFPIVANIPANRVWINDGENGVLITPNSVKELADSIISTLRDTTLREKAVRSNRRVMERRGDIRKNMRIFEDRYLALMEKTSAYSKKHTSSMPALKERKPMK